MDGLAGILLLAGFFALIVAGYGGLYAGLLMFAGMVVAMLAIIGISALEKNKDR